MENKKSPIQGDLIERIEELEKRIFILEKLSQEQKNSSISIEAIINQFNKATETSIRDIVLYNSTT